MTTPNPCSFLIVVAGLVFASFGVGAAPVNKCVVNGAVTYQQSPCSSNNGQKPPTVQELNAKAKERRAAAAATTGATTAAATPAATFPEKTAPVPPKVSGGFSCDGRQYCSQMKSCGEAKYFLANCPGVNMDGDKNGIPCEKQWCSR